MTVVVSVLSAVFWGALFLSLLVLVHEGGHFLLARAFGMRVTEFYLGLPCRFRLSWKSKSLGTEFGVTPFLLGGYNRICGMESNPDDLLAPALAIVQREGRVEATALARELGVDDDRAYAILASLADMGSVMPFYDPARDEHPWQSAYPAAFQTLQRDANLLTEYDRGHDFASPGTTQAGEARPIADPDAFLAQETSHTYRGKGFVARVLTLVAGPFVNVLLTFVLIVGSLTILGVETISNATTLGDVEQGSLADAAGLKAGDTILQLDGQNVSTWNEFCEAIDASLERGGDITVAYQRDGSTSETTIKIAEGEHPELIGVYASIERYRPSLVEASAYAVSYMRFVGMTVAHLIMPQHTMEILDQASSVVGISAMASEAASSGLSDVIMLLAALSISLGFMNLLPIPPLDGGKVLIEVVQLVARRPLPQRVQNAVSYVGLALILCLFLFAVKNDIVRLLG